MEKIPCRKCLLADIDDKELEEQIILTKNQIPIQLLAESMEYERRMEICLKCDNLLAAMCRKCGCYVEIRGAYGNNHCPEVPAKW